MIFDGKKEVSDSENDILKLLKNCKEKNNSKNGKII